MELRILWGSDKYHRVRANFSNSVPAAHYWREASLFEKEVGRFKGRIKYIGANINSSVGPIGDSLGMNEYYCIQFSSEEQMLLFLLKWG